MTVSNVVAPVYLAVGDEVEIFEKAYRHGLAIMLKGPTGCGKTRLVEYMAQRLGVPLFSVSCHEDMTASDLLGRYVFTGGDTLWIDGPLTSAVRQGGLCYLDEIVEARQDATVAIHSLTDHRRELNLERRSERSIRAADGFGLVVSYNPGYQSILKDLKMSTRQRMVSIDLGFPDPDREKTILMAESEVDEAAADALVRLGQAIRRSKDSGLREVASTRTLIAAATLISAGIAFDRAAASAIAGPLTDDVELHQRLIAVIDGYMP